MSDTYLPRTYGIGVHCNYCQELRPNCDISTDEDGEAICEQCADRLDAAKEWEPCDVY